MIVRPPRNANSGLLPHEGEPGPSPTGSRRSSTAHRCRLTDTSVADFAVRFGNGRS